MSCNKNAITPIQPLPKIAYPQKPYPSYSNLNLTWVHHVSPCFTWQKVEINSRLRVLTADLKGEIMSAGAPGSSTWGQPRGDVENDWGMTTRQIGISWGPQECWGCKCSLDFNTNLYTSWILLGLKMILFHWVNQLGESVFCNNDADQKCAILGSTNPS